MTSQFSSKEGLLIWTSPSLPDATGPQLFTVLSPPLLLGYEQQNDCLPIDHVKLSSVKRAVTKSPKTIELERSTGAPLLLVARTETEANDWLHMIHLVQTAPPLEQRPITSFTQPLPQQPQQPQQQPPAQQPEHQRLLKAFEASLRTFNSMKDEMVRLTGANQQLRAERSQLVDKTPISETSFDPNDDIDTTDMTTKQFDLYLKLFRRHIQNLECENDSLVAELERLLFFKVQLEENVASNNIAVVFNDATVTVDPEQAKRHFRRRSSRTPSVSVATPEVSPASPESAKAQPDRWKRTMSKLASKEGLLIWTSPSHPDATGPQLFTVLSPPLLLGYEQQNDCLPTDYVKLFSVKRVVAKSPKTIELEHSTDVPLLLVARTEMEANDWLHMICLALQQSSRHDNRTSAPPPRPVDPYVQPAANAPPPAAPVQTAPALEQRPITSFTQPLPQQPQQPQQQPPAQQPECRDVCQNLECMLMAREDPTAR